jgi:hypothetical protein
MYQRIILLRIRKVWVQISALTSNIMTESFRHVPQSLQYNVGFFLNSHSGGWSPSWFHSARRPLNGLLYLPRVIMMKNLVEWRLAGETEVLGRKSAPAPLCPPQIPLDQTLAGRRGGKPATNRLSYGAAYNVGLVPEIMSWRFFPHPYSLIILAFGGSVHVTCATAIERTVK